MKKYLIKENQHYTFSNPFERLFSFRWNVKYVDIKFSFVAGCWWKEPRNNDDNDVNKLCGITFGFFGLHKNSIRLGWKPDFSKIGKVKIYVYWYENGKRESFEITTVDILNTYNACIYIKDDTYIVTVNRETRSIWFKNKKISKWNLKTFPYFGGNNSAPKNIIIELQTKHY
jgi:hypothetical protein